MTIQGAIEGLHCLLNADDIPFYYKGGIKKIIETVDRPQGKWIPHPTEREWDVCDNCGTGCKRREHGEIDGIGWVKEYNYPYCPNCGARMDKED